MPPWGAWVPWGRLGGFGGSFAATLAVSRTVRIHKGIILTDLSAKFDAEEFQSKEA